MTSPFIADNKVLVKEFATLKAVDVSPFVMSCGLQVSILQIRLHSDACFNSGNQRYLYYACGAVVEREKFSTIFK